MLIYKYVDGHRGFPGGSMVKNLPATAGDVGLVPGLGRSPGGRNGNPLQYSYLENPVDRGVWWATVHGVAKSQTWLSEWAHIHSQRINKTAIPSKLIPFSFISFKLEGLNKTDLGFRWQYWHTFLNIIHHEHPFHLSMSAQAVVAQKQYQESIAQTKTSSNGLLRNNTLLGWGLSTSAWYLVVFPGHYAEIDPGKPEVWLKVEFGVSDTSGIREGLAEEPWNFSHTCSAPWLTRVWLFVSPWTVYSPSVSSVYGIFHIGILEWVAISYSRGSSRPGDRTCVSCISCIGRRIFFHLAT